MTRLAALGLAPALFTLWWATLPDRLTAPDLVLVTVDTLRADHADGPAFAALAATGTLWEQAVTTAPLTAPAHASMLTGLEVPGHGLLHNGGRLLAPSVVPALRAAGYATGAFVSAHVLDRSSGLDVGFEIFDGAKPARGGAITVARALAWYRSAPRPRFLWVHLYEPHAPYEPPSELAPTATELAAARAADREARRSSDMITTLRGYADGSAFTSEQRLLYAREARWADALLGRLLAAIASDAVVIATSDHGEAFGEHDSWGHGGTLFEEAVRVPLVVRWPPRLPPGSRRGELTSVARIAGTLLEAAGLPRSTPSLTEPASPRVVAYTSGQETAPRRRSARGASLRLASEKVVLHRGEPPARFDLVRDPSESSPAPAEGATARELLELIGSLPDDPAPALRSLGYTGSP